MSSAHLVLVGLMGSGKSTVGRVCAERIGFEFADTDELVETTTGATVAEIFAAEGEDGFRRHERAVVADVVQAPTPHVIACGGGVVLDSANRTALRSRGVVIWLDAPSTVLAERVGADPSRPLLASADPATTLARLAEVRHAAYEAAAHARVDASGAPDVVADAVLAAYDHEQCHVE